MDDAGSTSNSPFERSPAVHQHARTAGIIDILDPSRAVPAAAMRWLRGRADAVAAHLRLDPAGEVRVRVVRDPEMDHAHTRYKGVPGTTDVLTFDLAAADGRVGGPLDVDLLVCWDEAVRQASARGHAPEQELLLYIVHGLLHCLGDDDATDEAAAAMHAREDEILRAIGVGATYAAAPVHGGSGEVTA
jgi:probable rRNA maturation factor